jgi:hypothetical protein
MTISRLDSLAMLAVAALIALALAPAATCASPFATQVVSTTGYPVGGLYGDPQAVLGAPTSSFIDPFFDFGQNTTFNASLVNGPFNTDTLANPVVTTVNVGQELIVSFDSAIIDNPLANNFGIDFIVFGNSFFQATGGSGAGGDVTPTDNMENITLASFAGEQITVSVAQSLDGPWYTYTAPFADQLFPMQAYEWSRDTDTWGDALDPTKPVDPSLTVGDFLGLSVADAIDLYNGSMGGTGFDLAASGFASIQYIKFTGTGGEIDAVAIVPEPATLSLLGGLMCLALGRRRH